MREDGGVASGTRVKRRRRREPLGDCSHASADFQAARCGLAAEDVCDPAGRVRQAGWFARKRDAARASQAAVDDLNLKRRSPESIPMLDEYLEDQWTAMFPRRERTDETNRERIQRYVLPYLPAKGAVPVDVLTRADLLAVQGALLKRRLSKTTIDGAFEALSALMRDCQSIGMISGEPGKGSASPGVGQTA